MAAFYKQSWFAPVASAATTFLFPSLGSAVGGAANSLLGGALSEGAANALGSSLIGGGIGALSNGAQGALTGGLAGGLTSGLMSATGLTGGLSGLLSNGTFSGAGTGAAGGFNGSGADVTRGLADRQATDAAAAAAGKTADSGVLSKAAGLGGIGTPGMIAGMALLGGLGSAMSGGQKQQAAPPVTSTDPNMTRGLSQVAFNRTQRPYEGDPKTYGMRPQHNYFDNNAVPVADGGYISDDQYPMRSERTQYEQAQAKLRQADQARRQLGYETPAMRAVRQYRSQKAIEAGELTGYAEGGMVGAPQMPPQAMMGQGPGQSPMGMPPPRPMGPQQGMGGGMPRGPMMGGFPGRGPAPMGGHQGRGRGPMGGVPQQQGALMQAASAAPQMGAPFARGGVTGPGTGRSDDIPAVLSDGEYVVDSITVALLGDGSSKAGAAKLDQMREEIRKRAGAHLAKGKMGPDAKPALAYIPGAR